MSEFGSRTRKINYDVIAIEVKVSILLMFMNKVTIEKEVEETDYDTIAKLKVWAKKRNYILDNVNFEKTTYIYGHHSIQEMKNCKKTMKFTFKKD